MQLRGQRVWLIGASSGIGAALAPELAAAGARLILSARRQEQLEAVAAQAARHGEPPLVRALDVRSLEAFETLYGRLREESGGIDVLLYNAGTSARTQVDDFDTAGALAQIDVNYLGLVRAVGTVLPDMVGRGSGEIVGVSSVAGYAGVPTSSSYSSSKAAMNAFLQSLRIELHGRGVGVTTISPGFVKTAMTESSSYRLPFMISAEAAARTIVREMLAGRAEIHFPRRLTWPAKLVTSLPRPVYERLAYTFMLGRARNLGVSATEASDTDQEKGSRR